MNDQEIIKKAKDLLNRSYEFKNLFKNIVNKEFESNFYVLSIGRSIDSASLDNEKQNTERLIETSLIKAFKLHREYYDKVNAKNALNKAIDDMILSLNN